ncbi:MAG: hypothetical protein KIH02_09060 [Parabacteroides sp.]|nr:hypothetical protein [Parabacteroides sp.]
MAFDVYLGNTDKRYNSTFQSDYSKWIKTSAVWKNAKDIDSPVLELSMTGLSEYPQWNAMYITDVSSYYWITSIVSVRAGVWQVSGVMDALATYRTDILNTDCYIEYGFNTDTTATVKRLRDARQNISQVPKISTAEVDVTGGMLSLDVGCYILSAVGANGGVSVWQISKRNMKMLINTISSDITDAITDLNETEILKYFTANALTQGSAISAIRSCIWIPISSVYIPVTDYGDVYLGDFNTGVKAYQIDANTIVKSVTDVNIPWPVADWRRMNCQILCYVPFVGTVGIPVDQCNNADKITFTWCAEVLSGSVSIRIDAGDYPVYVGSASIGCNYAIGSSNVPVQNFVSGSIQAIGGVIQAGGGILSTAQGAAQSLMTIGISGDAGAGLADIGQGIQNVGSGVVQALTPVVQCAGSLSSNAAMGQSMLAKVVVLYYPPINSESFSAVYAMPVMQMGKPVAGYCKTRGFSIKGNQRMSEKNAIASLMDSGVFIE